MPNTAESLAEVACHEQSTPARASEAPAGLDRAQHGGDSGDVVGDARAEEATVFLQQVRLRTPREGHLRGLVSVCEQQHTVAPLARPCPDDIRSAGGFRPVPGERAQECRLSGDFPGLDPELLHRQTQLAHACRNPGLEPGQIVAGLSQSFVKQREVIRSALPHVASHGAGECAFGHDRMSAFMEGVHGRVHGGVHGGVHGRVHGGVHWGVHGGVHEGSMRGPLGVHGGSIGGVDRRE